MNDLANKSCQIFEKVSASFSYLAVELYHNPSLGGKWPSFKLTVKNKCTFLDFPVSYPNHSISSLEPFDLLRVHFSEF